MSQSTRTASAPDATEDGDSMEDVGVGYWAIPPSIDGAAFEGETPEDEQAADEYALNTFWAIHARVHAQPAGAHQ